MYDDRGFHVWRYHAALCASRAGLCGVHRNTNEIQLFLHEFRQLNGDRKRRRGLIFVPQPDIEHLFVVIVEERT
jgi:hypothetical protein